MDDDWKDRCGFCLVPSSDMDDPRRLKCGHVQCYECLKHQLFISCGEGLECPLYDCRKRFREIPERERDNFKLCDVCLNNGLDAKISDTYCKDCYMKMCPEHYKHHKVILSKHYVMAIDDYIDNAEKLRILYCDIHEKSELTIACLNCMDMFCSQCMHSTSLCYAVKRCCIKMASFPHHKVSLRTAVAKLGKWIREEINVKERETELIKITKASERALMEYESETKENLNRLDVKIKAQNQPTFVARYCNLTRKYSETRKETYKKLVNFNEKLNTKYEELNGLSEIFKTCLKYSHEVDIIRQYKTTKDKMLELCNEMLPHLTVHPLTVLQDDEKGFTNMEEIDGYVIRCKISRVSELPKSMLLFNSVTISENAWPLAMSHSGGNTCFMMSDYTILTIIKMQETKYVARLPFTTLSLVENNLYDIRNESLRVVVRNVSAGFDERVLDVAATQGFRMTIVRNYVVALNSDGGETVVVFDRSSGTATRKFYFMAYPDVFSICPANEDAICLSVEATSMVYKFNFLKNEVQWQTRVCKPHGIANYRDKYILVTGFHEGAVIIHILDIETGEKKGSLSGEAELESTSHETEGFFEYIHIVCTDDTIVLTRTAQKTVHYYQLQF